MAAAAYGPPHLMTLWCPTLHNAVKPSDRLPGEKKQPELVRVCTLRLMLHGCRSFRRGTIKKKKAINDRSGIIS